MNKTKFDRRQIRQLLETMQMRVYELAELCSVTPEYMSQVLTGKRKPSEGLVKLIAFSLESGAKAS